MQLVSKNCIRVIRFKVFVVWCLVIYYVPYNRFCGRYFLNLIGLRITCVCPYKSDGQTVKNSSGCRRYISCNLSHINLRGRKSFIPYIRICTVFAPRCWLTNKTTNDFYAAISSATKMIYNISTQSLKEDTDFFLMS